MEIRRHPKFDDFLRNLKDVVTKAKVLSSISNLAAGNPGKAKAVGEGVWELRIDYGPDWRIYYTRVGDKIVLLLTGGRKDEQQKDIETAKKLARELKKSR
jgi:putative addiction module killer protein